MKNGAKPDYQLSAWEPNTKRSRVVGAAWVRAKGHVSIRLDVGTVLRWDDGLVLTMFPEDDGERRSPSQEEARPSQGEEAPPFDDDGTWPPFG